jgi:signal transduction histidine kinase
VLGRTAITLESVQVPDITMPGAYAGRLRENLIESGIRAILAVPMVYEGRLIGCLGVTRNHPGDFPSDTIELLGTFATQSALAIQNARLFREIEDKSRQLETASQHKSEFLANMSHELRTPLNAIIGFSEVLSERMFGELNEKQEEYSKDIHASGQHLLSLINDILDLSKIEAGRMELELSDFHLPTALDNALTLVRERAARRSITLQTSVDERLGQMQADERKVRQVVLNLLSNAIKFTPEGGRIDVTAMPRDGFVEVSVRDTGVGIAPEDQEAVFEEFRQVGTADKKVEGTGLGLTLCRKFVELHGGKIWVKSQVGVGSTFTFTLPLPIDQHRAPRSGGKKYAAGDPARSFDSARCPRRREWSWRSSCRPPIQTQRDRKKEGRALAQLALHPDSAPMHFDEFLGDAEPEPSPAELARYARVALSELREDGVDLVRCDPDPGVGDAVDETAIMKRGR